MQYHARLACRQTQFPKRPGLSIAGGQTGTRPRYIKQRKESRTNVSKRCLSGGRCIPATCKFRVAPSAASIARTEGVSNNGVFPSSFLSKQPDQFAIRPNPSLVLLLFRLSSSRAPDRGVSDYLDDRDIARFKGHVCPSVMRG